MQQRIEEREIWQGLLRDKDALSLREMSEKYGVTPSAIAAAFKRQGIRRRPAPSGPRANRKKEDLPPEPGEARRGRRLRARPASSAKGAKPAARPGSKDAKLLRYWDMLGKVPDTEIAKKARVSPRTVGKFRELHGIEAAPTAPEAEVAPEPEARPLRETPSVRRGRELAARMAPFDHLLGQVPDSVIAKLTDLSLQSVRHQRQKRGIEAAGKLPQRKIDEILEAHGLLEAVRGPKRKPAPAAAAPEAVAPAARAAAPAAREAAPAAREVPPAAREAALAAREAALAAREAAPAAREAAPAAREAAPAAREAARRAEPPRAEAPKPSDLKAWRVTFDRRGEQEIRVVVASTFVDAAQLAEAWIGQRGMVSLVESLGPALA